MEAKPQDQGGPIPMQNGASLLFQRAGWLVFASCPSVFLCGNGTPSANLIACEAAAVVLQDETQAIVSDDPKTLPQKKLVIEPAEQKQRCDVLAKQNQDSKTAKDYSDLIGKVDQELQTYEYLSSYQEYLRSLRAYALTRRGEMRMEIGFEFDRVANNNQATQAFEQALRDFEQAVEDSATQWKAQLNRGVVLGKLKRWAEAAQATSKSIELRPSQTHAYFNLAEINSQLGNWSEALAGYDKILSSSPDDRQALNGRGLALIAMGRADEALEIFDRLVKNGNPDSWLLTNQGDARQALGQWEEAEKSYLAALQENQHSAIYRRLAWLYATCPDGNWNRPEAALAVAKRSLASAKSVSVDQWDTLAAAQAATGAFDQAVDSLDQALRIEPENLDLRERQTLYKNGQRYVQSVRVASQESTVER